jgi:diguanylate cyclase (GGDEF)-like protein/PAS domain S-box-containing protein
MFERISRWHSIQTRTTVFTLAVFVLSLWSLSFFVSRSLQADMERLLGEQQFSVVTAVAKEVDDHLTQRLLALQAVANEMDAGLMASPAALQTRLEQRPLLQLLFNGGVWVAGLDGTAIADVPRSQQRIGINYMDRDFVAATLQGGKSSIGRPVMGKQAQAPVFAMSVAVRDAQGKVMGALVGVTNLGKPSFLDQTTQNPYGKTGGYVLIAAQHRQVVTATDKSRVMELLPAPGLNAWVDRFANGYEGSTLATNPKGVHVLVSGKGIPTAGWYMLAMLPTDEAFFPLHQLQQNLIWATLFFTLLAGALTWWVLQRQLAPLAATANAMVALAASPQIPQPLALTNQGEIGQLVAGFNRILQGWTQREAVLQENQQNLTITLNAMGDAVIATDPTGRITRLNPTAERLTGWALGDALGQPLTEVFRIINTQTRQPALNPVQLVMQHGNVMGLANHTTLLARDGRELQIADSAAPIRDASLAIVGVVLVFSDVTEKYRNELALKESEQRYRSLLENLSAGVVVHRPDTSIVLANAMAAVLLGLTPDQIQGKTATDPAWCFLQEDRTPMPLPDYPVNRVLASGETLRNQVIGVRHPDRTEPTWVLCNAYPMRDEAGHILQAVVTFIDITERKKAEAELVASEERWKFAIEGAGDGLWDWNVQTGEAFYSPRYKQMFGYADADFGTTSDEWSKRVHPDDAPGVFAALQPYIDGKPGTATVEFRMLCKDGSWMWTMGRGKVVERDTHGKPLRMIGTNADITERKQEQEKLQLAANVFTHTLEGIMITATDATILDVNEAFTRITGYSRGEAVGRNPRFLRSGQHEHHFYAAMWGELTELGYWRGEVWNRRKDGTLFAELLTVSSVRNAAGNVSHFIALFSDITERKAHEGQLEHIAHFDALTNLPNRVLLADRLQQAMAQAQRRQKQVAVAFLDLDGFKAINDHYGHVTGDQVLITLAKRMTDALREGDTLARIGGDEFVAVLIDLEDAAVCVPLLNRMLAAAALPVPVGDLAPQVSASLGVTFYPQAHDIDADQLIRQADQAMYQAKVSGKNRYCVFDTSQDSSTRVHFEGLECIRLALENQEFVLHYQPKVNMHSGQVIGAEALIRWRHPEKGLLSPVAFLPVIEDDPLAIAMGEWVIDTALTQMAQWQAAGFHLPVSVNIGARQLQQGNFVQQLQAILARHPQVNPASLALELLETSALADMTLVSKVIKDCAQMGVAFALDDFGTGYSSLTYLKRLRVALLKIDQSFVHNMLDDPDDLAILQGIIGLAAAFKREVIAEGVETVAHGTALLQLGCELAQGYGIVRPMPPEQLPAWVAAWKPDTAWRALR